MDALFRCGKKGISTSRGVQVDKSTNYLVVEEIPNSLATSALARSTRALALDIHSLIVFPGTLEAINLLNTPEDGILPTFSAIHCRWIGFQSLIKCLLLFQCPTLTHLVFCGYVLTTCANFSQKTLGVSFVILSCFPYVYS